MADSYSAELYRKEFPQPELDSQITKGRFSGKVAIVTGGNSGIGRACVERLSNDGATVAIFARNVERGEGLASELRTRGGDVKFYQVDVSGHQRCVEAVKQVAEDNGGMVHFLVNCHVAHSAAGNIIEASMEKLKHLLNVNVVGCASMIQACFPFMEKDGRNCAIVNIIGMSTVANVAMPSGGLMCTQDSAKHILTKCTALDLSTAGIRVNAVAPSWTWTPPVAKFLGTKERADDYVKNFHMSRRIVEAAGVASAVAFLCSKDAMYITGADLPVDCGYGAMGPEGLGQ